MHKVYGEAALTQPAIISVENISGSPTAQATSVKVARVHIITNEGAINRCSSIHSVQAWLFFP